MSHHRPTIQGWLTQPITQGRDSEGHTSAVNVLRMVGTSHQHHAAEPVPFRAQPIATDGIACYSRPGVMCMGDPNCHDYHCEGHPCNDATDDERDPMALRWFLAGYCGFIATCLVGIAYADDIYHWLTR